MAGVMRRGKVLGRKIEGLGTWWNGGQEKNGNVTRLYVPLDTKWVFSETLWSIGEWAAGITACS